ncbi:flagellar protein FlgN [Parasalinivibrio latis]|uniref:flagellar export chaperone FlgN n=1 Tax=Parasalinivibrio latis TaxID=2952610 RepID=UPI0030E11611
MTKETITALLTRQTDNIAGLVELLRKETEAIASRDSGRIQLAANEKLDQILKVQATDKELATVPGFRELLSDPDIAEKVGAIQSAMAQCKVLNEENGKALQRAQLSMHKLRNLFQQAMKDHEMTYTNEGVASGRKTLGTNIKA